MSEKGALAKKGLGNTAIVWETLPKKDWETLGTLPKKDWETLPKRLGNTATNDNHVYVIASDCHKEPGVFNK